jgi:hypothetical protein
MEAKRHHEPFGKESILQKIVGITRQSFCILMTMKKNLFLFLLAALLACGRAGVEPPTDANDEDAIYHIIIYDVPSAFNLDEFDLTVPDTSLNLTESFEPIHWWRTIEHDSLYIDIGIFNPGPNDTLGAVPYANVTVLKYFWGTLEVIAMDTSGGTPRRVRFSKNFNTLGMIGSVFEKVGFDYNSRRGWRLMEISDAVFTPLSPGVPQPAPRVEIQTPDSLLAVNTAVMPLRNLLQFTPGESITVNIYPIDTTAFVSIRYLTGNGYVTQKLGHQPGGVYHVGFTLPRYEEFGHFLVDLINSPALTDSTARYNPNAIGVLYRAR